MPLGHRTYARVLLAPPSLSLSLSLSLALSLSQSQSQSQSLTLSFTNALGGHDLAARLPDDSRLRRLGSSDASRSCCCCCCCCRCCCCRCCCCRCCCCCCCCCCCLRARSRLAGYSRESARCSRPPVRRECRGVSSPCVYFPLPSHRCNK
jgi:hypothetical protein